jgi:hypothetical protein
MSIAVGIVQLAMAVVFAAIFVLFVDEARDDIVSCRSPCWDVAAALIMALLTTASAFAAWNFL